MDMSFREKSAWGLLLGLGLVAYWYFPAAFAAATGRNAPGDLIRISIGCVVALVVIEIFYHAIVAGRGSGLIDERDTLIGLKAERIAGVVLGAGLVTLVGRIIAIEVLEMGATMNVLTVAVWILFALTVSEVAKLISQIAYYRFSA